MKVSADLYFDAIETLRKALSEGARTIEKARLRDFLRATNGYGNGDGRKGRAMNTDFRNTWRVDGPRLAEQAASHAPADLREVAAKAMFCLVYRRELWEQADCRDRFLTSADAALSAIAARGLVILPREPTQEMIRDVACALARDAGIADPLAPEPTIKGDGGAYWMCWESEARVALRAALNTKEP